MNRFAVVVVLSLVALGVGGQADSESDYYYYYDLYDQDGGESIAFESFNSGSSRGGLIDRSSNQVPFSTNHKVNQNFRIAQLANQNVAKNVQTHIANQRVVGRSVDGLESDDQIASGSKILPEPGWLPLTNPIIVGQTVHSQKVQTPLVPSNPVTITRDQRIPQHSVPAPQREPVRHLAQQEVQQVFVRPKNTEPEVVTYSSIPITTPQQSSNLVPEIVFKAPAQNQNLKNVFIPQETLSFQIETVTVPEPVEQNLVTAPRNERAVLPSEPIDRLDVEETLIDKVRRMNCRGDLENLIIDILQSPLRERNALLGILKMEQSKNVVGSSPQQVNPVVQQGSTAKDVVTNSFSNTFPNFQQKNTERTEGRSQEPEARQEKSFVTRLPAENFHQNVNQVPQGQNRQQQDLSVNRNNFGGNSNVATEAPPRVTTSTRRFVPTQIVVTTEAPSNVQQHFSIEEFLERYPEVRRVSSRFNDDKSDPTSGGNTSNGFGTSSEDKESARQNRKFNRNKNNRNRGQGQRQKQPIANFSNLISGTPEPSQLPVTTFTPIFTTTTTTTTTTTSTTPRPTPPPTVRTPPPPPPTRATARPTLQPTRRASQTRPPQPQLTQTTVVPPSDDFPDSVDSELSSDDYSYLYYEEYYEELVPEHHRFLQLASTTTTEKPANFRGRQRGQKSQQGHGNRGGNKVGVRGKKKNRNKQNQNQNSNGQFSFFVNVPKDELNSQAPAQQQPGFPNFPLAGFAPTESPRALTTTQPAPTVLTQSPKPAPVAFSGTDTQAGPFGYVDKGTFFTDKHVTSFPEKIEVIYQGFIWALDMRYPVEGRVMHGGVHHVLQDKVKRESVILKDDYIVRVEGRASPYNINRLTFYTAKGKQFGPWGDRRSKESIDFDVTAPPGSALAFISGTIDFGVPLRSVSFHWRPIPN